MFIGSKCDRFSLHCLPIAPNAIVGAAGDGIQELFNTQGIIGSFGEIQANYPKI